MSACVCVFDVAHAICSAFIANQLFPPLPLSLPLSLFLSLFSLLLFLYSYSSELRRFTVKCGGHELITQNMSFPNWPYHMYHFNSFLFCSSSPLPLPPLSSFSSSSSSSSFNSLHLIIPVKCSKLFQIHCFNSERLPRGE